MKPSETLRRWAAYGIEGGVLDELERILEHDAFQTWRNLDASQDAKHRERLAGATELLQMLRNMNT